VSDRRGKNKDDPTKVYGLSEAEGVLNNFDTIHAKCSGDPARARENK